MAELIYALAITNQFIAPEQYAHDDVEDSKSEDKKTNDRLPGVKPPTIRGTFRGRGGLFGLSDARKENSKPRAPAVEEPALKLSKEDCTVEDEYGVWKRKIDRGGYGDVHQVQKHIDGGEPLSFAVKVFRERREGVPVKTFDDRIRNEFRIAAQLQHETMIQTFDLMRTAEGSMCLVMEYCAAGNLYERITSTEGRGLNVAEANGYFRQIMEGLRYLHYDMDAAHRDLKPQNLLLFPGCVVKIADFGVAVRRGSGEKGTKKRALMTRAGCGSLHYCGPERYVQPVIDAKAMDIWATGLVYFQMRTGCSPWKEAKQEDEAYTEYARNHRRRRAWSHMEDLGSGTQAKCKAVLYKLLHPNPAKRITSYQFFKEGWEKEFEHH